MDEIAVPKSRFLLHEPVGLRHRLPSRVYRTMNPLPEIDTYYSLSQWLIIESCDPGARRRRFHLSMYQVALPCTISRTCQPCARWDPPTQVQYIYLLLHYLHSRRPWGSIYPPCLRVDLLRDNGAAVISCITSPAYTNTHHAGYDMHSLS